MLLRNLLAEIGAECLLPDQSVTCVTERAERASPGSLFVAVRGNRTDGHSLIEQVLKQGACGAVVSSDSFYAGHPRCIPVPDTRQALALLNRALAGHPQKKLTVIAVTGTCGKSTVTHMLYHIFRELAISCGLIGTVFCDDGTDRFSARQTTPCAEELWPLLARMASAGCRYCFMEASSQAIAQGRLIGLIPEIGIFTNFSQDHLDAHGSIQAYFEAKCRLMIQSRQRLIGSDDPRLAQLFRQLDGVKYRFGFEPEADYAADSFEPAAGGVAFSIRCGAEKIPVFLPLVGRFSAENAATAIAAAHLLGIPIKKSSACLADYRPLPGRTEWIAQERGVRVMVDFAHTPSGLQAVLSALKAICRGKLLLVFGCGGERDRSKRPKMAEAAVAFADRIVVTDDNPRREDPEQIISDLLPVLQASGADYEVIRPREKAIRAALSRARAGDIVLLAGKGHETVQLVGDETRPLEERAVVRAYYEANRPQKTE